MNWFTSKMMNFDKLKDDVIAELTKLNVKVHSIAYNELSTSIRVRASTVDDAQALSIPMQKVSNFLLSCKVMSTVRIQQQKTNIYVILRIKAIREIDYVQGV